MGRVADRISRRPFGRFESAFYEWAGAGAVADALEPRLRSAIGGARLVLDVGCGGGVLAQRLAAGGHVVVGLDPSAPQVVKASRAAVPVARSGAEALPVASASVDAVVSSCSLKHWADHQAGLAEGLRVVRPGGPVVIAEIDGDADRRRLRAFARASRIPRPFDAVYPLVVGPQLTGPSPNAAQLAAWLRDAGCADVTVDVVPDLPFLIARAHRPS